MAGANLTPRQKMINMMYLVLTALLALNVSAEILKAFHMVEESMNTATVNIDASNDENFSQIVKHVRDFPSDSNAKYVILPAATKARKIADELNKYIETMQNLLIDRVGGRKPKLPNEVEGEIDKADDIEDHANYLINQGHGKELKEEINKRVAEMIACAGKLKTPIKNDIDTRDPANGSGQTWESYAFEHTPISAVVTLMSKFQNDVKNVESRIIDELVKQISGNDFEMDRLEPRVIPTKGTFIPLGQEFAADILVAASSSKQENSITVGGRTIPVDAGIGKYTDKPSHEGEIEFKGLITAKKPNGQVVNYEFKSSYTALKPLAVIAATKMNVVYIGIENPISVSVPGSDPTEVVASVEPSSAGSLKPDRIKGTYLLTCKGEGGKLKVVASVKDKKSNSMRRAGDQEYRVRKIPNPEPALGTIEGGGNQPAAILKAQNVVRAPLKGFAFEGINYIPYEFTFVFSPKKGGGIVYEPVKGQILTAPCLSALARAQKGDVVTISSIKVKGPDGNRLLPTGLMFTVQ